MDVVETEPVTPLAVTLPGRPAELHAGIIAAFALGRSTPQERHPHPSTTLIKSGLDRLALRLGDGESVYVDRTDHLIVQMATHRPLAARRRMQSLIGGLVRSPLADEDGPTHVDVGSAWTRLSGEIFTDASRMREVSDQADQSLRNRDLVLRSGERAKARRKPDKAFIPLLTALSIVLTFALPLAIMMLAYLSGVDISGFVYLGLVAVLLLMSATQLAEGLSALRKNPLPPPSATAAPPATAIVAAYLPNEAATILETLRSVLSQEYDGGLQVILAYNSPVNLPVEDELRALAAREPRLELLRVAYSRSKADNVNAALAIVTGEFVGIFDADHHPMVGSFERAWRWFADGADVVQGHCVVRNGDESGIARLVAVEFEQIYAVSHPGRQRLHHFGIFGGSNGYWRTQLLRETRLRSQFLTEDIDSSIRAVRMGARIVNDPGLISRELAPVNFRALWKQRMRWAQGWFEVSLRHGHSAISPSGLSLRQRYGLWMLLGWRELFPWIASLMWPTLAFFIWRDNGIDLAHAPQVFWLTTAFTLTTGPILIAFAYKLGAPEIRERTSWWWQYVFVSVIAYSELKNIIVRVAQIRHILRQDEWVVTPRGHVDRTSTRS
jgi:cellulose synthase/poly-beta-1,6-N-acetylglucosamine synthase-like glycosyltransferase